MRLTAIVTSASSSEVSGSPVMTPKRTLPIDFAPLPLLSGVPTVRNCDSRSGGLQDGNESGAPCERLGAEQLW